MLQGIKILVVEDNALNQKIVGFMLKKQEAIFASAMSGKEAIELIKMNDFDVILMDLQMPGMSGCETATYIRKELKNDIPIIAATADLFVNETNDCADAGMNGYLVKPFDAATLTEMILNLTARVTQKI